MIKKVVSDYKIRYYILVIPLSEKGVNLSLRFKKYSYISMITAFLWMTIVSCMAPSLTLVAIVSILVIMVLYLTETWSDPKESNVGVGLTINYILLLSVSKIFIMHYLFKISMKACILNLLTTWVIFFILSIWINLKIDKDYCWIVFKYNHFGLRVSKSGYIEYSDDPQLWGFLYFINIVLFAMSSIPSLFSENVKDILLKMYRNEISFIILLIVCVNLTLLVVNIIYIIKSKSKYERLEYVTSSLLLVFLISCVITFRSSLVLSVLTISIIVWIHKKNTKSIDKLLLKLLFYSDLPIAVLLLNMNSMYEISGLGIFFVSVMTIPLFYSALILFALTANYGKMFAIDEAVGYEEVLDRGYIEKSWNIKSLLFVYSIKVIGLFLIESLLFLFVKDHNMWFDYVKNSNWSGVVFVIIGCILSIKTITLFIEKEPGDSTYEK